MSKKQIEKKEGNLYDKIFKENAEKLFLPLVEERLGIKIKTFKPLKEKFQTTLEREMDFFYEVAPEQGMNFLLHLEFQLKDDKEMIYRSAEYHGIALRRKQLEIKHIVIFLGKGQSKMQHTLPASQIFKGFDIINIHTLETNALLSSQIPEVILLAILSEFPPSRLEAVLRLILLQLKQVCRHPTELSKYSKQLIVLARIRKFEDNAAKIIEDMTLGYDIETDYLFLRGTAKGKIEGKIEGKVDGKIMQSIIAIRNMTQKKFKPADIADLLSLDIRFVKKIQKELLLEKDLLKALSVKRARFDSIAKKFKVNPLLVKVLRGILKAKKIKGKA